MTREALLESLKAEITPEERDTLARDAVPRISRYNRATLLRMLDTPASTGDVDPAAVEGLRTALAEYLDRYLPEDRAAHKWITLSCLFLAFVVREPLHPQAVTGWDASHRCPAREEGGICRWCICR